MAHVQFGIAMAIDAFLMSFKASVLLLANLHCKLKAKQHSCVAVASASLPRAGPIEKELRGDVEGRYSLINKS